jgi:hypothetical protein
MARICIVGDSELARDLRTLVRTDPDLVLHDGKTFATTIVELVIVEELHELELRTGTRVSPTELAVVAQLAHRGARFRVLADDAPDERTVYLDVPVHLSIDARACNTIATAIYTALLQSLTIDRRSWWRRLFGHAAIIMLLAAPAHAQLTSTSPSGGGGGGTVMQGTAAATTDAAAWPFKIVFGSTQIDPRDISDRVGRALGQVTFASPQHIVCDSGCGSPPATADTSAFTFGTTSVSPIGAVVDDVATNTVAENSFGAPRMSTNRVLLVDGSGVTQPVSLGSVPSHAVTNAGTFAVQVTSAPTTAVTNAGLSNLDVLLSTRTKPADQQHTIIDSGSISNTAFIANAGTSLNTSALALSATQTDGTQQTKITDGTNVAAVKAASTAALATDKAFVVAISPNNTVAVTESGAWTVQPGNTANTTPWLFKLDQTTTANDVDVLTVPALFTDRTQKTQLTDGTRDGTVKAASTAAVATDTAVVVAISPNNTSPTSLASVPTHDVGNITTSITPGGGAAQPREGGGRGAHLGRYRRDDARRAQGHARRSRRAPTPTMARSRWTPTARQFTRVDHPNRIRCTSSRRRPPRDHRRRRQLRAPGAGLSIYITDIMFSASATGIAADAFPTLKYGTGGTCGTGTTVFWGALTAATNFRTSDNFNTPIKIPANNEICWITTTAGSKFIVLSGFIAP